MLNGEDRFRQYIAARSVAPPAVLYKYFTLDIARIVLTSRQVRWSSPSLFNDPFDTNWNWFWQLQTDPFRSHERLMYQKALLDSSSWPAELDQSSRELLECLAADLRGRSKREQVRRLEELLDLLCAECDRPPSFVWELQADQIRRMRVFCLSEDAYSIPMWSHYAGLHEGVVIGFHTEMLEQGWRSVPVERVSYVDEPPGILDMEEWCKKAVFGIGDPLGDRARKVTLVKHQAWAYEHEWRFVSIYEKGTSGNTTSLSLPTGSVASIIFGCRSDTRSRNDLIGLAEGLGTDLKVKFLKKHQSRLLLEEG